MDGGCNEESGRLMMQQYVVADATNRFILNI